MMKFMCVMCSKQKRCDEANALAHMGVLGTPLANTSPQRRARRVLTRPRVMRQAFAAHFRSKAPTTSKWHPNDTTDANMCEQNLVGD